MKENNNLLVDISNRIKSRKYKLKTLNKIVFYFFLIIISGLLITNLYYIQNLILLKRQKIENNEITFEYNNINNNDLVIFESIQNKLSGFIEMTLDEQKYFFGLLRKIKPKKIVEIGISHGGSSSLILNAIKDIEGAKLYSIDKLKKCYKNRNKNTGYLVEENFPELKDKWTLLLGGITAEFIETIGNGIDLVLIDTVHSTPGEMLDLLMILPFLKEEAIIVLHDVFCLYFNRTIERKKKHTSNNQILCYLRGNLILPNYGDKVFFRNIGSIKLSPGQKLYYYHYFLALGIQWEYMPEKKNLKIMRDFFMKYYGKKYVEVYDDAVEKNRIYLHKN